MAARFSTWTCSQRPCTATQQTLCTTTSRCISGRIDNLKPLSSILARAWPRFLAKSSAVKASAVNTSTSSMRAKRATNSSCMTAARSTVGARRGKDAPSTKATLKEVYMRAILPKTRFISGRTLPKCLNTHLAVCKLRQSTSLARMLMVYSG